MKLHESTTHQIITCSLKVVHVGKNHICKVSLIEPASLYCGRGKKKKKAINSSTVDSWIFSVYRTFEDLVITSHLVWLASPKTKAQQPLIHSLILKDGPAPLLWSMKHKDEPDQKTNCSDCSVKRLIQQFYHQIYSCIFELPSMKRIAMKFRTGISYSWSWCQNKSLCAVR